ncbi:hypothetical protein ACTD5D_40380 [Nocardia takedensis]|uniref:hypothetical protein n=1 Tax=Nocardia takedensis TaxID=259390 RepID=UPI003F768BB6
MTSPSEEPTPPTDTASTEAIVVLLFDHARRYAAAVSMDSGADDLEEQVSYLAALTQWREVTTAITITGPEPGPDVRACGELITRSLRRVGVAVSSTRRGPADPASRPAGPLESAAVVPTARYRELAPEAPTAEDEEFGIRDTLAAVRRAVHTDAAVTPQLAAWVRMEFADTDTGSPASTCAPESLAMMGTGADEPAVAHRLWTDIAAHLRDWSRAEALALAATLAYAADLREEAHQALAESARTAYRCRLFMPALALLTGTALHNGVAPEILRVLLDIAAHETKLLGTTVDTPRRKQPLMSRESVQWLAKLARAVGLPDDALDELVIDLHLRSSSSVNNGGFGEQLDFVLDNLGAAETLSQIVQVYRDSAAERS